jgi:hypothetical protein
MPVSFVAQDPRTGTIYDVVLTGDRLIRTLLAALTDASLIRFVPLFTLMSQATRLLTLGGRGQSIGTFYSVNCAEEVSRTSAAQLFAARRTVRREIVEALSEDARSRICAGWGAAQSSPRPGRPVVSDAPALILAGEYNPLTPPSYAEVMSRTLRNKR